MSLKFCLSKFYPKKAFFLIKIKLMNSKLLKVCAFIEVSAALSLNALDFNTDDISSLDAFTPSKFMDGIERVGTPDELISTLADIRVDSLGE
jgi:hypothetical protein